MKHSETVTKIHSSIVKVQGALEPAPMDSTNPHFRNRYASLNSVVATLRPLLAKNGLSYVQGALEDSNVLSTLIIHDSGEWIETFVPLVLSKQDMQALGSALTYARRYGLCAAFGVISDEDDDGQKASAPQQTQITPQANGEYVVQFGKFKGMKLDAIPQKDLYDYCTFLKKTSIENGNKLSADASDFIERARKAYAAAR